MEEILGLLASYLAKDGATAKQDGPAAAAAAAVAVTAGGNGEVHS